jgi:putative DNA primase/helicase
MNKKIQHEDVALAPPLPQDAKAERTILAAILIDPRKIHVAVEQGLTARDFYSGPNGTFSHNALIFEAMVALAGQAIEIHPNPIFDYLQSAGLLHADLPAYLSSIPDGEPAVTDISFHLRVIKAKSNQRKLIALGQAFQDAGFGRRGKRQFSELHKYTLSTLEELATGGKETEKRATIVTGKELLKMDVKPREFLIDGLFTCRSMNEIFAWRGIGKTWAALSIGHAVASGGKFLRWQANRPRRVLFVDGELDAASLQQRLRLLGAADDNLKLLCADMQEDPFPNLATPRSQRMIEDVLGDAELLILDNLSALAPSSNETEGEDWISIQTWLLELRRRGIATIFLHHAGHAGWSRGTTRREDLLDIVIELRRPKDFETTEGLRFEMHFTKTRGMLGAGAGPIEALLTTDLDGHLIWIHHDLEDARVAQIVTLRSEGASWRDIAKATDIPKSTVERLWKNAQQK